MYSSSLDLIYVGNSKDMLMIEGSADQISEEKFVEALAFGHESIQPIITAIKELVSLAGKKKAHFALVGATPEARAIIERVVPAERISAAIFGHEKAVRSANVKILKAEAHAALTTELGAGRFSDVDLNVVFEDLQYKAYRATVLAQVAQGQAQPGKSAPWILEDATGDANVVAAAEKWMNTNPGVLTGTPIAAPAAAAAPAPGLAASLI